MNMYVSLHGDTYDESVICLDWHDIKMKTATSIGVLIFICLACVTLFVVSLVMINVNNDNTSQDEPVTEMCCDPTPTCTTVTCSTACPTGQCETVPGCGPCQPVAETACFTTIQSITSDNVEGGNLKFGEAMAADSEWIAAAQSNDDGITVTVYIFQNLYFGQSTATPQYSLSKTIDFVGTDPVIAMYRQVWTGGSRSFLSVGVTTPTGGTLTEYVYSNAIWAVYGSSTLTGIAPTAIAQYNASCALVANETVYMYSGGVINATFSNLGATSVSMDGNDSYSYLLIGCAGAAHLFTSVGTTMSSWGTPIKSYTDATENFGKQVSIQLPYFSISDFNQQGLTEDTATSRVIVYGTGNLDVPQAYIMLPNDTEEYKQELIGGSVYITSLGTVQMYSKRTSNICPSDWYQSYLWSFDGSDRTVTTGNGTTIDINNTVGSSYSNISMYMRVCG
jgi:hypothetical protein